METGLLALIAALIGWALLVKKKTPDNERITVTEIASFPHSGAFFLARQKYPVPLQLMVAIVDHESNFESKAVNAETLADIRKGHNVDSVGLGQILWPDTALALDSLASKDKLMEPVYNLTLTAKLIDELIHRYPYKTSDGFYPDAVAAYNAGSKRINSDGTYQNQKYVDSVRSKFYKWKSLAALE